jgi:uncharacterized protein (UPF0276 family)
MSSTPQQGGRGIALRPEHYEDIALRTHDLDWLEVITERLLGVRGGIRFEVVERVRRDLPVSLHGTTLSLGSVDPLDRRYLEQLKQLVDRIDPVEVSDHLAWSSFGGRALDLLPLPYTEESLTHMAERVLETQDVLGRRILLENTSACLCFAESSMSEWEFLRALYARTGCGILLDVNNLHVTAHNNEFDALEYLEGLPVDGVREIHVAGHRDTGEILIDTHEGPVPPSIWSLYREAVQRFGAVPTIVEWDTNVPPLEEMIADAHRAAEIARQTHDARRSPEGVSTPHAC